MIQVSYEALKKRYDQGWLLEIIDDLDRLMERIKEARQRQEVSCLNNWLRTRRKNHKITFFFFEQKVLALAVSHGNAVAVWEYGIILSFYDFMTGTSWQIRPNSPPIMKIIKKSGQDSGFHGNTQDGKFNGF